MCEQVYLHTFIKELFMVYGFPCSPSMFVCMCNNDDEFDNNTLLPVVAVRRVYVLYNNKTN